MNHRCGLCTDRDCFFLCFIPHYLYTECIFPGSQLTKFKLPFFIGYRTTVSPQYHYRCERNAFFSAFHNNVSGNHITFFNRIDCIQTHAYTRKHKHNYIIFHCLLLAMIYKRVKETERGSPPKFSLSLFGRRGTQRNYP